MCCKRSIRSPVLSHTRSEKGRQNRDLELQQDTTYITGIRTTTTKGLANEPGLINYESTYNWP